MRIINNLSLKYHWTHHVKEKMKYYQLSEQRIKRVVRNPARAEKGIAPHTTAVMQPITKKGETTQEIWVMFQDLQNTRIIITAWRYPGKSLVREEIPIPDDIRKELEETLLAEGYQ